MPYAPSEMSRIEIERVIAAPAERLFDLARSVEAHVASATGTSERVAGGKTAGLLDLGEEVTWEARHFGVTQRLTSRMTMFDRPRHFRDSMVRGAFRRFDHDHWFEPVPGATVPTTRCRDVFDFDAPLGPLGWIAERLVLERYMRRFLEERLDVLAALATGDGWEALLRRSV